MLLVLSFIYYLNEKFHPLMLKKEYLCKSYNWNYVYILLTFIFVIY